MMPYITIYRELKNRKMSFRPKHYILLLSESYYDNVF